MKKIIALLFLPIIASSAIRGKKEDLTVIKDELGKKARQANKLAASIKSLEKQIGKVNNNYLERTRQNRQLGAKLEKLNVELSASLKSLNAKERKAAELVRLYALESSDDQDQNSLLKTTILKKLVKERLAELKSLKKEAEELQETFSFYKKSLAQTKANEESLYTLIVDLENRKKDLSRSYITSLESKNEWEEKLENALAKKKAYSSISTAKKSLGKLRLLPPLESFIEFKAGDKGVTFKYDSRTPVKASASGKVVYSGELASYGKVVMIDHGGEVRSVILGDIQIKARKGDQVKQGQILGYTLSEPGLKKSLYYEVRKKNIAQNTLQWLENESKLAEL